MSKEIRLGIALASEDKGLKKRAVICRTGSFDGMYGPVTVTKEMLEKLCAKYLEQRASPQNENDYAPILIDHMRSADLVKGRLLTEGMEVKEWREVDGVMEYGLYATLRFDDEEAKSAVESGKYAHLSISFDDQSCEIFEVSCVAVEAARGSIVLSKGGFVDLEQKITALSQKHTALGAVVKESREKRKVILGKLVEKKDVLTKEAEGLMAKAGEIGLSIKAGQMKGKFAEFVRGGKMSPHELSKMDFKTIALMGEESLRILLGAYDARQVSSDVIQHGQAGQNDMTKADKVATSEEIRSALQSLRRGERPAKATALAEGEEKPEEKPHAEPDGDEAKPAQASKSYAMGEEEWKKCMEDMGAVHAALSGLIEKIKAMGADAEEMSAAEKESEEKEEKELAADEAPKDKKEGEE